MLFMEEMNVGLRTRFPTPSPLLTQQQRRILGTIKMLTSREKLSSRLDE
jgi:hypothetical protein